MIDTTTFTYAPPETDTEKMLTQDGDPVYVIVKREVVIVEDSIEGWGKQPHPVLGPPPDGKRWGGHIITHMLRSPDDPVPAPMLKFRGGRVVAEKDMAHIGDATRYLESWLLTWFSHWTYEVGQSDADALASFRRFVWRHHRYQEILNTDTWPEPKLYLMGADDEWRWSASAPPGEEPREGKWQPPCRCQACKTSGVIRVDH